MTPVQRLELRMLLDNIAFFKRRRQEVNGSRVVDTVLRDGIWK